MTWPFWCLLCQAPFDPPLTPRHDERPTSATRFAPLLHSGSSHRLLRPCRCLSTVTLCHREQTHPFSNSWPWMDHFLVLAKLVMFLAKATSS